MIIAVGTQSSSGKIAAMISDVDSQEFTPLQLQLQALAITIGRYGIAAATLVSVILASSLIAPLIASGMSGGFPPEIGLELLHIVIIAITIVVVSVP